MSKSNPKQPNEALEPLAAGRAVKKRDFTSICHQFMLREEPSELIRRLMAHNKFLAETVILFRQQLRQSGGDSEELQRTIDRMYRHYVINTQGPIPASLAELAEADTEDRFNPIEEATAYAKFLGMAVSRPTNGRLCLHFNGQLSPFPDEFIPADGTAAKALREIGPQLNKLRYGRDDVIPSFVFDFNETADELTLENAMILADFANLAYLNPDFIKKQLTQWGYHSFVWFEDERTDTQAFLTVKGQHVILSFRGTNSLTDGLVDLKIFMTASVDGRGKVHRGFKSALDSVWGRIAGELARLGSDKQLFFTGHSLGAALAQLAAYRQAITDLSRVAGVYVYGSPRVANADFKTAYDRLLLNKTFLHVNNTDLVPQVPPRIFGFRHLGQPANRFDRGHGLSKLAEPTLESDREVESLEELAPELRAEILAKLRAADRSIKASTEFLRVKPEELQTITYSATFETGKIDDHGMDQYLFKFGCAIIDGEFKRLSD